MGVQLCAVFDLNSAAERPDELLRPFVHQCFAAIYADYGGVGVGGSMAWSSACVG